MRLSEYKELLENALKYFKERKVFSKIFTGFRKKYESLGHLGGSVVLQNLSNEEKTELSGFFQKDFYKNKTVTISMNRMEKALKDSRFESLDWMEILESYFGQKLVWKQALLEQSKEKQQLFFDKMLTEIKSELMREWLQYRIEEATGIYQRLQKEYRNNPDALTILLKRIEDGITNLPIFHNKKMKLAVFAAQVTGNPHFFDSDTTAESFLFDFILYHFHSDYVEELSEIEYRNQQYYKAGIIKDDISNYVMVYGIHAKDGEGMLHPGIEGFFKMKEPMLLTLYTISNLSKIYGNKRIYIVENPAVFSWLSQKYPEESFVCSNGQLRFSAFLLLDQISKTSDLLYAGDYDPEGLLIAQRLKVRYKEKLKLWNYSIENYEKYRSDVILNNRRLKQLDQIDIKELKKLKGTMKYHKTAAYQESMLETYKIF